MEHLSEPYGLLTILVLGESFVKVLTYLTGLEHGVEPRYMLKGFFTLMLTCCIRWIYFDDVAGAEFMKGRGSWVVWFLAHLPVTMAITAVGVGVKKAVAFEFGVAAPESYRWLLAGSQAMTFLSVALIDSVTERRNQELSDKNRVMSRLFAAFLLLLLGEVGGSMNREVSLGLIAVLCQANLIFGRMMVPLEASQETHKATLISDTAKARREAGQAQKNACLLGGNCRSKVRATRAAQGPVRLLHRGQLEPPLGLLRLRLHLHNCTVCSALSAGAGFDPGRH
jgi:hypothetical protein